MIDAYSSYPMKGTLMNPIDEAKMGLFNIRDSYEKMMNKGMANNRPFHINQLGRRIRALRDSVAILAVEYPMMLDFHRQMGPIVGFYGRIVDKGYKNAKQECSDLEAEIRLLDSWLDNKDIRKSVPVKEEIPVPVKVASPLPPAKSFNELQKELTRNALAKMGVGVGKKDEVV